MLYGRAHSCQAKSHPGEVLATEHAQWSGTHFLFGRSPGTRLSLVTCSLKILFWKLIIDWSRRLFWFLWPTIFRGSWVETALLLTWCHFSERPWVLAINYGKSSRHIYNVLQRFIHTLPLTLLGPLDPTLWLCYWCILTICGIYRCQFLMIDHQNKNILVKNILYIYN